MDNLCRLCCSMKFVRNYIFDDANDLYNKISLYMPIKVFKNDELPQKICDKCTTKVNDFYQFFCDAIEIQKRLKAVWAAYDGNLTENVTALQVLQNHIIDINKNGEEALTCGVQEQATQTEEIKTTIKQEPFYPEDEKYSNSIDIGPETLSYNKDISEDSDNVYLVELKSQKKHKKAKKKKNKDETVQKKRGRPKKVSFVISNMCEEPKDLGMDTKSCPPKVENMNNGMGDDSKVALGDSWKTEPKSSGEEWSGDEADIKPWDMDLPLKQESRPYKKSSKKPSTFYCCMCNAQSNNRADMLLHYKAHEAALEDAEKPAPPPPPPDGDEALRCSRCKMVVAPGAWAAHWARHWERDRRPLRCRLCERSFSRPADVMRHGLTHRPEELRGEAPPADGKDLMCDHCPETFTYMRQLLSHRTRQHPASLVAPLSLRCGRCRRVFAHANSLRRHLAAHEGRRDYLCYICGKSLSSKEHLKYHTRIHTGYKPYVCKVCGKGFAKKCNLTLHERTHSGEKPHACPVCRKAFSQRSTLTIHQRYHSGERPYVCSLCGRGFVARGLLSMHLKTICV